MIRYECDRCGAPLSANDPGRYIVRMEAFAAAGPVEWKAEDMDRDHADEIRSILDTLTDADPDKIEDQTYRRMRFDLCPACHRKFLAHPLGQSPPTPQSD